MFGYRMLRVQSEDRHKNDSTHDRTVKVVAKEQVPWALIHSFAEKNPELKDEFQA
jgi:hypothetical protein